MDPLLRIGVPAFVFGLLGSAHCAGMCGPLVVTAASLGSGDDRVSDGLPGYLNLSLLYNAGRLLSFTLLGTLAGALSQVVVSTIRDPLTTKVLAGVAGGLMILVGGMEITGLGDRLEWLDTATPLKDLLDRAGDLHPYLLLFLTGVFTGLLPCGLLWAALAGAASTGSAAAGGLFMLAFSLGAFPALFTIALVGAGAGRALREKLQKAGAVIAVLLGAAILWRGYKGELVLSMDRQIQPPEIRESTESNRSAQTDAPILISLHRSG